AAASAIWAWLARSRRRISTSPRAPRCLISVRATSALSRLRQAGTVVAPAAASAAAVSNPIPVFDPVTSAVMPSRSGMSTVPHAMTAERTTTIVNPDRIGWSPDGLLAQKLVDAGGLACLVGALLLAR